MKKIIYEILLRQQDEDELIVDVRKTIEDHTGEEVFDEYTEGFSFTEPIFYDRYRNAKKEMVRLTNKYTGKIVEDDLNHPENEHMVVENDDIYLTAQGHLDSLSHIIETAEKELEHNK
tara:strand:- start:822 stop:1175 length:354 start_codon:yes stop_codon:yes gene_type:complete